MRRALVEQIERLVRQEAVSQIAAGKINSGLDGLPCDADAMVRFQPRTERFEHAAGRFFVRFPDGHGTEAALERSVLFDELAVFLHGRRADHLQFSPAKGGLEQIGRVDCALGAARADDGVHLVNKQNDVSAAADLDQDIAHALFELAAVFRAREQVRHVEAVELFPAQRLRYVAAGEPLGQRLDDGGLADAGLADERGIIFAAAAEHLHELGKLRLAADDGVHLRSPVDHVVTVYFQKLQFRLSFHVLRRI